MKNIAVFCGSSSGNLPQFKQQAYLLGKELADRNLRLVYGGAKVGLMGAVADGVLENGGKVTGILPHFLKEKELAHEGLTEIILVDNMHQRKALMYDLSDGVIVLPGGFGTLDEMFEFLTWGQLNLHKKPVGLLDVDNYFSSLIDFVDNCVRNGFLKEEYCKMLLVSESVVELLSLMEGYSPSTNDKWFVIN